MPLFQGIVKVKKEKLTNEEVKELKKSHPLLSNPLFQSAAVMTLFHWAGVQSDPWMFGDKSTGILKENAYTQAFKPIADFFWEDRAHYVDTLVIETVCDILKPFIF